MLAFNNIFLTSSVESIQREHHNWTVNHFDFIRGINYLKKKKINTVSLFFFFLTYVYVTEPRSMDHLLMTSSSLH